LSRPKLIKQLKEKNPKLNKPELESVIDTFSDNIKKALIDGRKVEIRGFGIFFVKKIKEKHSAINPRTGEFIYVPEKNKVRFRASKNLKKLINE
jgi:integration host factor subunit beta